MKLTKKPTLREKKRYIYFKVHSNSLVKYVDMRNAVFDSIFDMIGELGFAKSNVHFVKNLWDQKNQTGVLKCSHLFIDHIKLATSLIHQIGESKVAFQSLRVSGTIKGLTSEN